ncbi:MAG: hypothetical protein R3325_11130 [Thermoanaerobaculia bacterium]|nr:hypothetical protein [Thermoanaerobaculia bacterium]
MREDRPTGRSLAEWLVPPAIARRLRLRRLRRELEVDAFQRRLLARNAGLRHRHRGRRCFVIGNGPSLNELDLAPLGRELTFVMSRFHLNPVLGRWRPTYYFNSGAEPVEQIRRQVAPLGARAYFFKTLARTRVERVPELHPGDVYFLLPGERYLFEEWPEGHDPTDPTGTLCKTTSGSQLAILMALWMGCSPIVLIGHDHDWLARPDRYLRFYESPAEKAPTDPGDYSYRRRMEGTLAIWRTYERLRDTARRRGQEIVNATRGGYLDVFPRVDYEDLVSPGTPTPAAPAARRR